MGEAVQQALSHAGHLLPDQAPIRVFIHHNTLHAFQHLPFHTAVRKGHEVYGAEPYAKEERFRAYLAAGRITLEDLGHDPGRAVHDAIAPSSRDVSMKPACACRS